MPTRRGTPAHPGAGHGEYLSINAIEAPGDVAGVLDMRHLVFTHRYQVGFGQQDVGHLAERVIEETQRYRLVLRLQLADLGAQSGVLLMLVQWGQHAQEHGQLGVLGHVALYDERCLFRIQTNRHPVGGDIQHRPADQADVVQMVTHCLVVGNQKKAFVFVLQLYPVLQRTQVVSQVQLSRGAHSGQNSLLICHVKPSPEQYFPMCRPIVGWDTSKIVLFAQPGQFAGALNHRFGQIFAKPTVLRQIF